MKLHYRYFACDKPQDDALLILHGLFGSRNNWAPLARQFARHQDVYALDLRNHGDSQHADSMSYPEMANDILWFLESEGLAQVSILGHSMGGKVAMQTALDAPQRIKKLIVADIAPKEYAPRHEKVFEAVDAIDQALLTSRADADKLIKEFLPDKDMRLFLLTSLSRDEDRILGWRTNMHGIRKNYQAISAAPTVTAGNQFKGPALFIGGTQSPYVKEEDREVILSLFPKARLEMINAGHWMHVQAAELFFQLVSTFLQQTNTESRNT
ncbi:MAG: alpha/beta fold hydrolase [Gammaproteobacteria bacterium]|nr:alpha/beta fold hydrolase [Gammaproteobacteria bacterium]